MFPKVGDGEGGLSAELEALKKEFLQCNDANEKAVGSHNATFLLSLAALLHISASKVNIPFRIAYSSGTIFFYTKITSLFDAHQPFSSHIVF